MAIGLCILYSGMKAAAVEQLSELKMDLLYSLITKNFMALSHNIKAMHQGDLNKYIDGIVCLGPGPRFL